MPAIATSVRALLLGLLLQAPSPLASPPADAVSAEAAAAWADGDAECDASDEACAVSLRQLRAASLAPDAAGGGAGAGAAQVSSAEEAALLQRTAGREDLQPTSLASSLTGKTWLIGYHQTSLHICDLIIKGGFRPGHSGWCGGAIYFADSRAGTFGEATGSESHQGCIIQAWLDMGSVKRMPEACDSKMTGEKLKGMGYDSIIFNDGAGTGNQYVLYDASRVHRASIVWTDKEHNDMFEAKMQAMVNDTMPPDSAESKSD